MKRLILVVLVMLPLFFPAAAGSTCSEWELIRDRFLTEKFGRPMVRKKCKSSGVAVPLWAYGGTVLTLSSGSAVTVRWAYGGPVIIHDN